MTNAVIVKKSCPLLFTDRVEWIFCFTEWIVFGVQSSSFIRATCFFYHYVVYFFTCAAAFGEVAYHSAFCTFLSSDWTFVLSWPVWCPATVTVAFLNFVGFPAVLLLVLFYVCSSNDFSSPLLFRVSHLVCRKCTLVSRRLLLLPTCHSFWFFSLGHNLRLIFRWLTRTLMLEVLLRLLFQIRSSFQFLVFVSIRLLRFHRLLALGQRNRLCCAVRSFPA